MPLSEDIQRTQVPIGNGDDEWIRVYYSPVHDAPPMPSVSVVKGLRADPEKEDALEGWRERFDGKSNWSRPWYEDQKAFKGYRGTLIHFAILAALGDQANETSDHDIDASGETYFHEVGGSDDNWGHEEYYAEYALKKWSKKAPSANSEAVPYSPRANKYDGEHAWDKAVRDMKWATRTFKAELLDSGRLDPSNVIAVEDYVFDTEYGYGGQYDLLYTDADGRTVLSDLKTSSGIRFDHKLQAAAYKRAVESGNDITVDECEIVRLHPDSEEVEISRSPKWDRTVEGLEHCFLGLCDQAWNVTYADALQRAKEKLMDDDSDEHSSQTDSVPASAD